MKCTIYIHKGRVRVSLDRNASTRPDEQLVSEFVIEPEFMNSRSADVQATKEVFGSIDTRANHAMRYTLESVLEKFISHLFTA